MSGDAAPVIIFIASFYAFGFVLVYALARAWEQALSTRRRREFVHVRSSAQVRSRRMGAQPNRSNRT
ncbi:hypothetical protein [Hyphomicrobium sp. 2TAF46]|uniref:hypothetical protein n=1 Tax=Hyphomicrobium sp. 2TAF46 TaxID=3233019 RepID=UPI003F93B89C